MVKKLAGKSFWKRFLLVVVLLVPAAGLFFAVWGINNAIKDEGDVAEVENGEDEKDEEPAVEEPEESDDSGSGSGSNPSGGSGSSGNSGSGSGGNSSSSGGGSSSSNTGGSSSGGSGSGSGGSSSGSSSGGSSSGGTSGGNNNSGGSTPPPAVNLATLLGIPAQAGGKRSDYLHYLIVGGETLRSFYGYHNDSTFSQTYTVSYIQNELATDNYQYKAAVKGRTYYFVWKDINALAQTYGQTIANNRGSADLNRVIYNGKSFLNYYDEFRGYLSNANYSQFIPQARL